MIHFRDFTPRIDAERDGFWQSLAAAFSPQVTASNAPLLDKVVADVNAWVMEADITVVNIETVVVPTILPSTANTMLTSEVWEVGGVETVPAFQFIRVWYRDND